MTKRQDTILVFGATGQQGGSVAAALQKAGWRVRALVRDPASAKADKLRDAGIDIVKGDQDDAPSIRAAMAGAYGVFSIQPSSGQGARYGVTDADEVRYGTAVADAAVATGIAHLVYSSASAAGDKPVGIGYFDSKGRIEAHIRSLPITATIVRPVGFMDMLVRPGLGIDTGHFMSFAEPDQAIQVIAVEDIGKFVAAAFADRARFGGVTLEIASDMFVAREIADFFTEAAGRPITYSRFPDQILAANRFLARMAELMNGGPLAGHADMDALRAINPDMVSFRSWLAGSGREAFRQALGTDKP